MVLLRILFSIRTIVEPWKPSPLGNFWMQMIWKMSWPGQSPDLIPLRMHDLSLNYDHVRDHINRKCRRLINMSRITYQNLILIIGIICAYWGETEKLNQENSTKCWATSKIILISHSIGANPTQNLEKLFLIFLTTYQMFTMQVRSLCPCQKRRWILKTVPHRVLIYPSRRKQNPFLFIRFRILQVDFFTQASK